MKNIIILFFILSAFSEAFGSVVSGSAYLDNNEDNSNITITFTSSSLSGVNASITNNPDGSFSSSIENGLYIIEYSKIGYQTIILDEILIDSDITLSDVILSSMAVKLINGNVEGVWHPDTVYHINGNTSIESGKKLQILAGTNIIFNAYYELIIYGELEAVGTETDSIIFTSNSNNRSRGDWKSISLNSSVATANFNYCRLEYGADKNNSKGMLQVNSGYLIVENSCVRESDYASISISSGGKALIRKNIIYNNRYYSVRSDWNAAEVFIDENIIYGNGHSGILAIDNVEISNNVVYDNIRGIYTYANNNIYNNIVFNNTDGIAISKGTPLISNNTITSNKYGITLDDNVAYNPSAKISSNIIYGNDSYAIYSKNISLKPTSIDYNLINNNGGFYNGSIVGLGTIITTNVNGTNSDTFYNIFEDPEFYSQNTDNEYFVYLKSTSSAIDAGHPSQHDVDGSIIDIGALPYLNIGPSNFELINSQIEYYSYDSMKIYFNWNISIDADSIAKEVSYQINMLDNTEITYSETEIKDVFYSFTYHTLLKQNQEYKWFVTSTDGLEFGESNDTLTFTPPNLPPSEFQLISPVNESEVDDIYSTILIWESNLDTDEISYSVSIHSEALDSVINNIQINELNASEIIQPNENYSWSVFASDGIDTTYSDTLYFSTPNIPPSQFQLISPSIDQIITQVDSIQFQWTSSMDSEDVLYSLHIEGTEKDTIISDISDTVYIFEQRKFFTSYSMYNWSINANDRIDTTSSDTRSFEIANITSINPSANNHIFLFPNPASDRLFIQSNKDFRIHSMKMIDLLGKEVYSSNISSGKNEIDLRKTPIDKGIYQVLLFDINGKTILTQKLILE